MSELVQCNTDTENLELHMYMNNECLDAGLHSSYGEDDVSIMLQMDRQELRTKIKLFQRIDFSTWNYDTRTFFAESTWNKFGGC